MSTIMRGEATQAQIAGFLVALRAKGETADEIAGCAEAMREHVLAVKPKRDDLVDIVGTGGDGANTYNISTAAALVAAAAGAGVAKHGNRAASSATGAADVLEALGFRLELPPERIERSIDELGFGFLFAQAHHPAMRHAGAGPARARDATVFNVLGPLTNPAGARALMLGVYSPELARDARGGARPARRAARVRRPRRGRHRRALAVRARTSSARSRAAACASTSSTRSSSASSAATRRAARRRPRRRTRRRCARVLAGADGGHRAAVMLNAAGGIAAAGHARGPARGDRAAHARRSTPAPRRRGSTSSSRSRRRSRHEVRRRTRGARPRRDRRVQAALAVDGRHPPRRAIGAARREYARARRERNLRSSSTSVSPARSTTCAQRARPPACRCSPRASSRRRSHLRELREAGADAALLILRDLDDETRARLLALRAELGLDTLVEAHDEEELAARIALGAPVIGDQRARPRRSRSTARAQLELVARAPRDRIVIAESARPHTRAGRGRRARGRRRRPRRHLADAGARSRREAARPALAPAREGVRPDAAGGRRRRGRGGRRPRSASSSSRRARAAPRPCSTCPTPCCRSPSSSASRGDAAPTSCRSTRRRAARSAAATRCSCAASGPSRACSTSRGRSAIPGTGACAAAAEGRVVLAGGLGPDNVREAIDAVQPWAVDAASSLECEPGIKDHDERARIRRGGTSMSDED